MWRAMDGSPRPSPIQTDALWIVAVVFVTVLSLGLSVGIAGLVLDRIMRVAHRAAVRHPPKSRRGPAAT